jgi:four helix bundle protein
MLDARRRRKSVAYKSYKDLDIYKKAHKLAIEIHQMSLKLPTFEMYEEGSQIRRSSKSVVNNIVEGFGRRRYKQEFIKFLTYSLASCDETREHLDTLYETKSLNDKNVYEYFCEEYDHLGRMINNFIKSVEDNHKTGVKNQETSIEHQESRSENETYNKCIG